MSNRKGKAAMAVMIATAIGGCATWPGYKGQLEIDLDFQSIPEVKLNDEEEEES